MGTIGVMGLGVMGESLVLNLMDHGFEVVGYNRTSTITERISDQNHKLFLPVYSLEEMVSKLERPRKIMLVVKAGEAVDSIIEELIPLLEKGDIIMDGGNSFFKDTNRREKYLKEKELFYYGVGISGGQKGARFGPSLMPAGSSEAYGHIQPILEAIAAKVDGVPCCRYIGPEGSGHYVKMVHNGIEYADMQLIVEAYLLLKKIGKFSNQQVAEILDSWNQGKAKSYLLEITVKILKEKDKEIGLHLLDLIKDQASQKGTGRWSVVASMEQDINASSIVSAYLARVSSNNIWRSFMQESLQAPIGRDIDPIIFAQEIYKAYYAAKIVAYSQGFELLQDASKRFDWNLNLKDLSFVFQSGCIIQGAILKEIENAYQENSQLDNILLHPVFLEEIKRSVQSMRVVNSMGILHGLPLPTLTSSLVTLEQLRNRNLGANLIQAQRDFFGAHQFERIDKEGVMHYEWED